MKIVFFGTPEYVVSILSKLSKSHEVLGVVTQPPKPVGREQFKKLVDQFEQIVISGYPPYIKDIIDNGKFHGIDWKKYKGMHWDMPVDTTVKPEKLAA